MKTLLAVMLIFCMAVPAFAQTQAGVEDVTYRFANLTETTGFDLYRNDRNAFFAIEGGQVSAERVINSADTQVFRLYPQNASIDNTPALAEITLTLAPNSYFVLIARQDGDKVILESYNRDVSNTLTHRARLQVIHVAQDVSDVAVMGQNEDLLFSRAGFAAPVQADIPSGNYQLSIVNPSDTTQVLAKVSVQANGGSNHTLLIYGSVENVRAQSFSSQLSQKGLIRFVHAAPRTSAVDIYLNEERIFSEIYYKEATDYIELELNSGGEPTGYELTVYPAGADPTSILPILQTVVTLSARFAVTGMLEQTEKLRFIPHADDLQQISINKARTRFINATFNLPLLTVADQNGNAIIEPIEYPNSSSHRSISAGFRTLIFRETQGENVFLLQNFNFEFNHSYTFILLGDASRANSTEILILEWSWRD